MSLTEKSKFLTDKLEEFEKFSSDRLNKACIATVGLTAGFVLILAYLKILILSLAGNPMLAAAAVLGNAGLAWLIYTAVKNKGFKNLDILLITLGIGGSFVGLATYLLSIIF